ATSVHYTLSLHDALPISAAQAHFAARHQALVALGRIDHVVVPVDIDLATERQNALAHVLLGMARQRQLLDLPFGIVGDGHLQRTQHAHGPRGVIVQVVADAELQHAHVDHRIGAGDPDAFTEFTDRSRGIATATEAADGGHARVIPAIHMPLVDQQLELALAGDRVVQV